MFKNVNTVAEAINKASAFLRENNKEHINVEYYWQLAFSYDYSQFVLQLQEPVEDSDLRYFEDIIRRVIDDEPIEYIVGHCFFNGRKYFVNNKTLIPRQETEEFLYHLPLKAPKNILDIGTGSGILAIELALKYPNSNVTAIDISKGALDVARKNANLHEVEIDFIQSDLFENIPNNKKFDLIVSNPPYIAWDELDRMDQSVKKYEPKHALYGGVDGLDIYKRLAYDMPSYLSDDFTVLLEISDLQADSVTKLMKDAFSKSRVSVHKDIAGRSRLVEINEKR